MTDSQSYESKCILIINILKKYRPDVKFEVEKCGNMGHMEIYFPEYRSMLTINQDSTWKKLKRVVDSKLDNKDLSTSICNICIENVLHPSVSCSECAKRWCYPCYIKIYEVGKGLVTCPYCKNSVGEKMPDIFVRMGVEMLKDRYRDIL